MNRKPRPLFVIADGGRARFVERHAESGALTTLREIDGTAGLASVRQAVRDHPATRTLQGATGARSMTGPDDPYRQAKVDFSIEVAGAAVGAIRSAGADGLILVAPARTLAALKKAIGANTPVLGTLAKDLTKTPDSELDRWLAPLERTLLRLTPGT